MADQSDNTALKVRGCIDNLLTEAVKGVTVFQRGNYVNTSGHMALPMEAKVPGTEKRQQSKGERPAAGQTGFTLLCPSGSGVRTGQSPSIARRQGSKARSRRQMSSTDSQREAENPLCAQPCPASNQKRLIQKESSWDSRDPGRRWHPLPRVSTHHPRRPTGPLPAHKAWWALPFALLALLCLKALWKDHRPGLAPSPASSRLWNPGLLRPHHSFHT